MVTPESQGAERRSYAIAGCAEDMAVWGAMLRAALRALRLPHQLYKSRRAETDGIERLVRGMRKGDLTGLMITGQAGYAALEMADELDESASRAGCATTLLSNRSGVIVAYNTMYSAFVEHLQEAVRPGTTAVVVGAGARAAAAVACCRTMGFQVVGVTSRSWRSTEALHERTSAERLRELDALTTLWPALSSGVSSTHFSEVMRLQFREIASSSSVLFQTVPVAADSPDAADLVQLVDWPRARRDAVVVELAYGAKPSPFLRAAKRQELTTFGGVEMLSKQAARLVETWTGLRPPQAALARAAEGAIAERAP